MKISWGIKITVFYCSFVVFILTMVYMAFGEKFELVTEDYYAKEIKFQQQIDSKTRANMLSNALQISIADNKLKINFPNPKSENEGTIHVFRPSDQKMDFDIPIQSIQGIQQIPLNLFNRGKYLFKIEWNQGNNSYYSEQTVYIP